MQENGMRRVVWMPKKLDLEIEKLRQRIGYTRSGFYRYALTRLLEQMLLSKRKEVKMQLWDEIVGRLETIEDNADTITAVINCTQNLDLALAYPKGTQEAQLIQNARNLLGQKIAIIKTDQPDKPITIRQPREIPLEKPQVPQKVFWRICGFVKCVTLFYVMVVALRV